jgi:hypothetical protein
MHQQQVGIMVHIMVNTRHRSSTNSVNRLTAHYYMLLASAVRGTALE